MRKPIEVISVDDDASHRPEFNTVGKDRKKCGRRRKINFNGESTPQTSEQRKDSTVAFAVESKVNEAMWAIRRTPKGSKVTCSGTP